MNESTLKENINNYSKCKKHIQNLGHDRPENYLRNESENLTIIQYKPKHMWEAEIQRNKLNSKRCNKTHRHSNGTKLDVCAG